VVVLAVVFQTELLHPAVQAAVALTGKFIQPQEAQEHRVKETLAAMDLIAQLYTPVGVGEARVLSAAMGQPQ
jgi:hypothetical protein